MRFTTIAILFLMSFSAIADTITPPMMKRGMPGKNRGDIIAPILDEQIAAWCDFNKQIVVTKTNVLCAYVGNKTAAVATVQRFTAPAKKIVVKKKIPRPPKDLTPTPYEMSEYGEEA